MKSSRLINEYKCWLLDRVGYINNYNEFRGCFDILWDTPYHFDPMIPFEDNVCENAISLRQEFFGAAEPEIDQVRVLEVLVSLCIRYEWFDGDITAYDAFNNILSDLGLINHGLLSPVLLEYEDMIFIVDKANMRAYNKLGEGGFFDATHTNTPTIDPKYDARFVDLWTQIRHRYI